ncbi:ubiquinone biosynthesis protein COQ7-domain-containing protein [Amylocarpus encephaloides]|uniref:5-demethoxyubiquinone hydroxylase, mitochondrial n=1 Tax=Amylocarpus encephaloides TaxID=45428 RepID=A0A9P8CAK8_9HELO|nr:ubiquinone biosynthesis protein COQ7-domain-containing protein [Amylocarpus encephaloides]
MARPCCRKPLNLATQSLLYDFLAPSCFKTARLNRPTRQFSTSLRCLSSSEPPHPHPTPRAGHEAATDPATRSKPLTQAQRDFLTSALRVNQAGELAATLIYKAQTPPIVASHPHLRPLMKHMYDQEAGHLATFNSLLAKHRIRPTAMYPIWTFAASALGWGTAIMSREAAMACTEAVETVIGTHYNQQVGVLLEMVEGMEERGEEVGEDLKVLIEDIRRIRDEELEHLDHAVENDAQKAVPHELLTGVIRAGCRGAIWVSEKV